MERAEKVLKFYTLCNTLKDVVRTGWKNWNVKRERIESVAEHVYGVQMLAFGIYSEYKEEYKDLDFEKVIMMLAIHELEETVIGDFTFYQITKEEKNAKGHAAVAKILKDLANYYIKEIIEEFDARQTNEAKFAYFCDKLECDVQCKLYDEQKCVDVNFQTNNIRAREPKVAKLIDEGASWSYMWMTFGQERYNYDKPFLEISNFAKDNEILHK